MKLLSLLLIALLACGCGKPSVKQSITLHLFDCKDVECAVGLDHDRYIDNMPGLELVAGPVFQSDAVYLSGKTIIRVQSWIDDAAHVTHISIQYINTPAPAAIATGDCSAAVSGSGNVVSSNCGGK